MLGRETTGRKFSSLVSVLLVALLEKRPASVAQDIYKGEVILLCINFQLSRLSVCLLTLLVVLHMI